MIADSFVPASLDVLSTRQRRVVERHLPLVQLTIARLERSRGRPFEGSYAELFQEGSVALIKAVRTHDAARHGDFAPFAMARIRFAVGRFLSETRSVIRVPYTAQRRERRRRFRGEKERHHPFVAPRVVSLLPRHGVASRLSSDRTVGAPARGEAPTVGGEVRARYERAAKRVIRRMARSSRVTPLGRRILRKCAKDRWSIPAPEAKTSIRKLAKALDCPANRVMRYEERFIKRMDEVLREDADLETLLRMSRRKPDGMDHRLTRRDYEQIQGLLR